MQASQQRRSHKLSYLLQDYAELDAAQERDISGLSLDSRSAAEGDLFFACAGGRTHGLRFLQHALEAGVAAVAWEPTDELSILPESAAGNSVVPIIEVKGLGELLGVIASRFYGAPSEKMLVVGITGTDGKTSCSQFLGQSLDRDMHRCGVIGTLGYGLVGELNEASHTTPDALRVHALMSDMQERDARYVVMEVSSHALDQGRVNGVSFAIAILTNLTRDHLDYHGDIASYAAAKRRLFGLPGLQHAVLNHDDLFGCELINDLGDKLNVVSYGFGDAILPSGVQRIQGSDLKLSRDGFSFSVVTPWGNGAISSSLLGRFNASNLLAVLAGLLLLDIPFADACARLESLVTVTGRMERFESPHAGHPLVVVDYAHTPDALASVLSALRDHCAGKLWCVFGCGGDRDRGKRPLMGEVAQVHADEVIITDDNPRHEDPDQIVADIMAGITRPETRVIRDRADAIREAVLQAGNQDIVLVAGKGHEEYQLIGDRRLPFSDRAFVRELLAGGRS